LVADVEKIYPKICLRRSPTKPNKPKPKSMLVDGSGTDGTPVVASNPVTPAPTTCTAKPEMLHVGELQRTSKVSEDTALGVVGPFNESAKVP
jgi:hypothetical protein